MHRARRQAGSPGSRILEFLQGFSYQGFVSVGNVSLLRPLAGARGLLHAAEAAGVLGFYVVSQRTSIKD